jgi:hypothetical protein
VASLRGVRRRNSSILVGVFPLLTSTMLVVAAFVLTDTISTAKAFGSFANASVLLVVIASSAAEQLIALLAYEFRRPLLRISMTASEHGERQLRVETAPSRVLKAAGRMQFRSYHRYAADDDRSHRFRVSCTRRTT